MLNSVSPDCTVQAERDELEAAGAGVGAAVGAGVLDALDGTYTTCPGCNVAALTALPSAFVISVSRLPLPSRFCSIVKRVSPDCTVYGTRVLDAEAELPGRQSSWPACSVAAFAGEPSELVICV